MIIFYQVTQRVTEQGIIDVGLPDDPLMFCTRTISRIKRGTHKYIKLRSFKHYSADFKETLTSINFPNYQNLNDATEAYDDLVAIDKVTPIKERKITIISRKHNSQEWFDVEISEAIKNRDKLLKKFTKSKLHFDRELYNAAEYKVHKLIFNKKKGYFENKLNECIGKPKELWKALKSLGSPKKIFSFQASALKVNKTVQHDNNLFFRWIQGLLF